MFMLHEICASYTAACMLDITSLSRDEHIHLVFLD